MRLIDADAFIAKLENVPMVQEAISKAMDTMPTIEDRKDRLWYDPERKKGRWDIEHLNSDDGRRSYRFYRCTSCGSVSAPALFVDKKWLRYCPNCGAEMMKGEENVNADA